MRKILGLLFVVTAVMVAGFFAGQLRGAATGHAAGLSHRAAAVKARSVVPAAASKLATGGIAVASITRAHASSGHFTDHTASVSKSHAYSGGSGGSHTTTAAGTVHKCTHTGTGSWGNHGSYRGSGK
jgi:hypothetical protein